MTAEKKSGATGKGNGPSKNPKGKKMETVDVSYLEAFIKSLSMVQLAGITVAIALGSGVVGFIIGFLVFGK